MQQKQPTESAVRSLAQRQGYMMRKSRKRESYDQQGEFMLIEADRNLIVLGERFDATLSDVRSFLSE